MNSGSPVVVRTNLQIVEKQLERADLEQKIKMPTRFVRLPWIIAMNMPTRSSNSIVM